MSDKPERLVELFSVSFSNGLCCRVWRQVAQITPVHNKKGWVLLSAMEKTPDTKEQTTNCTDVEKPTSEDTEAPKVNGTNLKSILKVKVETAKKNDEIECLPNTEAAVSPTNPTDVVPIITQQPRKPPRKKVHGLKTVTTLSYDNPAFDAEKGGEVSNGDQHLSDVVDKMLDIKQDKNDWHPYGRISMYEEVLSGKNKSSLFESEKVILWFIFAILLVGMAGGIIFLSETYSASKSVNVTSIDMIE